MSTSSRLRPNCLNFSQLLAQNIALISPTMTAALIVPVMYSNTGDWSWLSYALGTVMLLFVAYNLNQFASRSTTSGSMYAYTCRGLGLEAHHLGVRQVHVGLIAGLSVVRILDGSGWGGSRARRPGLARVAQLVGQPYAGLGQLAQVLDVGGQPGDATLGEQL